MKASRLQRCSGLDECHLGGFCGDGVLTVEGSAGGGDAAATRSSRAGGAQLARRDAGHHTRDGYAPRTLRVERS